MFGWGYAKDLCISLFQKEQDRKERKAAEVYISENLRIIGENTAKLVALASCGKADASYIEAKLTDILNPKPVDNRTAEEVIDGIRKKLNK